MRTRRRQVALVRGPLPDEFDSLEEFLRARHLNSAYMPADEIEAEAERLRIFLLFVRAPVDA